MALVWPCCRLVGHDGHPKPVVNGPQIGSSKVLQIGRGIQWGLRCLMGAIKAIWIVHAFLVQGQDQVSVGRGGFANFDF